MPSYLSQLVVGRGVQHLFPSHHRNRRIHFFEVSVIFSVNNGNQLEIFSHKLPAAQR
jgi:hypothetical protein